MTRRAMIVTMMLGAAACGGSKPGPTTPSTSVLTTDTFSGTTVQTGTNSCSGDSHNITAFEGDISVRLVATSDPNAGLSIQVCPGGIDSGNNCSIAQQRITIGQTLTGARRGVSQQNVKPLPWGCVFGGTATAAPITYTLAVTYMK